MVHFATDGRPLPDPTPVTRPWFDAAAEGRFVLPKCPRDGWFFYPRARCPRCLRDDWTYEPASGRGVVAAFTVDRVGHDPRLRAWIPYAVAIVELEEGPRLTARVVDCEVDDVAVGMPVEVAYETVDDVTLVHVRPTAG